MDNPTIKTCFVIIGYGEKVDPLSQRHLNLDRVFENIIQPVFQSFSEPKFDCFRACDKNYGGLIDAQMYKWIMEADFVVADISTLNPNVIYELGIRHALRPFSTLIIAEDGIREFPFDINHVKIEKYKHLGEDIGVGESKRFTKLLTSKIQHMLNEQSCDSPVYTYIDKLKPPYIEIIKTQTDNPDLKSGDDILKEQKLKKKDSSISLAKLISRAENEMKLSNYEKAFKYLKEASSRDKQNLYIKRKMVFATYKSETPDKKSALVHAKDLLERYFDLKRTIDRDILELSGTIYMDLAETGYEKGTSEALIGAKGFAKQSAVSFHKAYVISDDLVMACNYGHVLLLEAVLEDDLEKKYNIFMQALLVWKQIYDKAIRLYNYKKNKNPNSKNNYIFLEWLYQALVIVTKNKRDEETENIAKELAAIHETQRSVLFYKRLNKIIGYVDLVRSSLINYRPKLLI